MSNNASPSGYYIYSIGIVAQNKHLDSDFVQILPIEVTPYVDGELDSNPEKMDAEGKDKYGEDYKVTINKDEAVTAEWLRISHTNRRTSPDVRRGERVLLYRHSDSERLYWDSMGMDDHLRRLETVIYSWSATPREEDDATLPQHSYSLEICTHTKQVTFMTEKDPSEGGGGDGEPYKYTFQFNTGYGSVVLTDHVGNFFELDSPETCWTIYNIRGTYTRWDKDDIIAFAPGEINAEAIKRIFMKCGSSTIEMLPSEINVNSPMVYIN